MSKEISNNILFENIAALLKAARQSVFRTVNQTMVHTYFEIGKMIIEDEQQGLKRAEYGKKTLEELSTKLTQEFGKGFSVDNLQRMKNFYLIYSSQIYATPLRKFNLSWSHYLKLMRISNTDERNFYEIESFNNNWSLKELDRQCDSAQIKAKRLLKLHCLKITTAFLPAVTKPSFPINKHSSIF